MPATDSSLARSAAASPGFLDSSVGKKVVMALTGIVLFGFVTVHMLGNLQAYMGAEPLNHYADFLQNMVHGGGIWVFRAVMLTAAGLHAWAALSLTLANWKARRWATGPSSTTPRASPPAPCAGPGRSWRCSSFSTSCT